MIKRFISVMLSAVLLLSVAVPALAATDNDDKMPVITDQPQDIEHAKGFVMFYKTGITSTIPSRDHVGYELYSGDELIATTYNADLIFNTADDPSGESFVGEYYIVAFNMEHPEYRVTSESFEFKVRRPTLKEKYPDFFKSVERIARMVVIVLFAAVSAVLLPVVMPLSAIMLIIGSLKKA